MPPATAAAARRAQQRERRLRRQAQKLFAYDRRCGSRFVAGTDEAGRGCLAGPLVAAAVLFDYERLSRSDRLALGALNDSKQRLECEREELYPVILRAAARVAVTARCAAGIDRRGLHVTNLAALRETLARVAVPGGVCLVDGFRLGPRAPAHRAVKQGDATSAAIAAASVIAKVTRDRFMRRAAAVHPGWGFDEHVGYSTPEHRDAIGRLGVTPLHRRSFASVAYTQLRLAG